MCAIFEKASYTSKESMSDLKVFKWSMKRDGFMVTVQLSGLEKSN